MIPCQVCNLVYIYVIHTRIYACQWSFLQGRQKEKILLFEPKIPFYCLNYTTRACLFIVVCRKDTNGQVRVSAGYRTLHYTWWYCDQCREPDKEAQNQENRHWFKVRAESTYNNSFRKPKHLWTNSDLRTIWTHIKLILLYILACKTEPSYAWECQSKRWFINAVRFGWCSMANTSPQGL
jgi:hypothetical protein